MYNFLRKIRKNDNFYRKKALTNLMFYFILNMIYYSGLMETFSKEYIKVFG